MSLQRQSDTDTINSSSKCPPSTMEPTTASKDIFQFMKLPGELRNMIYGYAANWNDASEHWLDDYYKRCRLLKQLHDNGISCCRYRLLRTYFKKSGMRQRQDVRRPRANSIDLDRPPHRTTPNVLLLSHQITEEASSILRRAPLVLRLPDGQYSIPVEDNIHLLFAWQAFVSKYISFNTLIHVPKIIFELPSTGTMDSKELIPFLHTADAHSCYGPQMTVSIRGYKEWRLERGLSTRRLKEGKTWTGPGGWTIERCKEIFDANQALVEQDLAGS